MPIHLYRNNAEGDATMVNVRGICLGSQRFAGQDKVKADAKADAIFKTV